MSLSHKQVLGEIARKASVGPAHEGWFNAEEREAAAWALEQIAQLEEALANERLPKHNVGGGLYVGCADYQNYVESAGWVTKYRALQERLKRYMVDQLTRNHTSAEMDEWLVKGMLTSDERELWRAANEK